MDMQDLKACACDGIKPILFQAIKQLASILRQADDLFTDLGSQCSQINQRTARIKTRLEKLGPKVDSYNPRKQKIREYQPQ